MRYRLDPVSGGQAILVYDSPGGYIESVFIRFTELTWERGMEQDLVLFGILAIAGSTGVAIGDAFLLGNPVSGKRFREQGLDNLLHVSSRNMLIGHTLGVLALPLVFFGILQIYRGLQPAGSLYALPPVLIMVYMVVVGAAAHACFGFVGGALQFQQRFGDIGQTPAKELLVQHKRLLYPLFGTFLAGLIISSLWFSAVVWSQPTLFPRWTALVNPFFLFVVLGALERFLPAPVGGYVRPANGNICFVVFFSITTLVLA